MSDQTDTKLKSRKFAVWLVWLVLTIFVIVFSVVVMVVSQTMPETLTALIEKVLGWFFAVSMMYLGMNAGQKVGFAFSDAISTKTKEATEAEG